MFYVDCGCFTICQQMSLDYQGRCLIQYLLDIFLNHEHQYHKLSAIGLARMSDSSETIECQFHLPLEPAVGFPEQSDISSQGFWR